jgi:hypothetical protein
VASGASRSAPKGPLADLDELASGVSVGARRTMALPQHLGGAAVGCRDEGGVHPQRGCISATMP